MNRARSLVAAQFTQSSHRRDPSHAIHTAKKNHHIVTASCRTHDKQGIVAAHSVRKLIDHTGTIKHPLG